MMSYKFMVMAVLCFGGITHAMEQNGLQLIQKWEDVEPFANKVVAYTARTYWLNDTWYKYALPHSDLSYAYIDKSSCKWTDPGKQFTVLQLYKKDSVQCNTKDLTKNTLDRESLKMRDITAQEAREIIAALTSEKAVFSCVWCDKEEKLISQLRLIAEK